MWELKQLLSGLAYPLGTSSLLLGLGILGLMLHWRRLGLVLAITGFGWLWLWSTPMFSDWVRQSLEGRYPHWPAEQVPSADAIVVLGGAFSHVSDWPHPDVSSAGDRYWHGARLFQAGKGQTVILSGGRSPGRPPGMSEAAAGREFLVDLGIPESALRLDERALTTRDNAVNVADLMADENIDSFLLVTSALHMRRSEAAFRAVGLEPIPVATDFEVGRSSNRRLRRWLPSAAALAGSSRAVHEYVGYWVYWWRGWV